MIHTISLSKCVEANDPILALWIRFIGSLEDGIVLAPMVPVLTSPDGHVLRWQLVVYLDGPKMFKSSNLTARQLAQIIPRVNAALVPVGLTVSDFNVQRIDYAYNAVMEDSAARKCLFDTLNQKAPTSGIYLFRTPGQYETTIRSSTEKEKSRTIQVYDKEAERESKGKTPQPWEQNIVRTEVQVKTGHVAQRVKSQHITRNLSDWLTEGQYRHYMAQAWKYVYKGDFYALPEAKAIVEASRYTPTIKGRLSAFLETVAANDMDTAQAALSKNTALSYIDKLDKLGVNPITLPNDNKYSTIPSPFRFF